MPDLKDDDYFGFVCVEVAAAGNPVVATKHESNQGLELKTIAKQRIYRLPQDLSLKSKI